MTKTKIIWIVANLVLVLGFVSFSTFHKEQTLAKGKLVLFELAPVDPRSLMQGDYMRLRYAIISEVNNIKHIQRKGYCIFTIDKRGIVEKILGVKYDNLNLAKDTYAIKYHLGSSGFMIGAESYFFQEGQAQKYEAAKYGGLRIDSDGNSVLVGLFDDQLKVIR